MDTSGSSLTEQAVLSLSNLTSLLSFDRAHQFANKRDLHCCKNSLKHTLIYLEKSQLVPNLGWDTTAQRVKPLGLEAKRTFEFTYLIPPITSQVACGAKQFSSGLSVPVWQGDPCPVSAHGAVVRIKWNHAYKSFALCLEHNKPAGNVSLIIVVIISLFSSSLWLVANLQQLQLSRKNCLPVF